MSRILTIILIFVVIRGNSQEKLESYSYFNLTNINYSNSFLHEPIKENLFLEYFKNDFDYNLKIESPNLFSLQYYQQEQYFNKIEAKIENKILLKQSCPGTSYNNLESRDLMQNIVVGDLVSRLVFKLIKPKKD